MKISFKIIPDLGKPEQPISGELATAEMDYMLPCLSSSYIKTFKHTISGSALHEFHIKQNLKAH
jgi:hypothetical protein